MADEINPMLRMALTPEQEAILRRQAIGDAPSPFDVFPMGLAGLGVGAGVGAIGTIRNALRHGPSSLPENLRASAVTSGITGLYGSLYDVFGNSPYKDSIRDAEGQPGGFYGRK